MFLMTVIESGFAATGALLPAVAMAGAALPVTGWAAKVAGHNWAAKRQVRARIHALAVDRTLSPMPRRGLPGGMATWQVRLPSVLTVTDALSTAPLLWE
jgi:hypothetical protein